MRNGPYPCCVHCQTYPLPGSHQAPCPSSGCSGAKPTAALP